MPERPTDEEIRRWDRWFAVETNNHAWKLTELVEPTEDQREEALRAAFASAFHWSRAGDEHNRALALVLLARASTVAREPGLARRYAEAAFAYFASRESEPWELAFAHAVLADAAALDGDDDTHRRHYEQARTSGASLEPEDRVLFAATFDRIPPPR